MCDRPPEQRSSQTGAGQPGCPGGCPGWPNELRSSEGRNAITTSRLSADAFGTLHIVPETAEIVALCLEGEFDMANAPRIVEESEQVLVNDKHLILDLSRATFIDSSVINALFVARKQANARGRLAVLQLGTAAIVELVLELSGIERVLPRVHTRAEAIATIHQFGNERKITDETP